ncbi:MAG: tRNA (guanosine(37)-N1)-methyltransferase TrmD [Planctomycetota bacterium]
MHCAILTLFPEAIRPYLDESILGIAQAQGHLRLDLVDFRNWTSDPHRTVDDRPFGGGPGMVLKPEPIFSAIEHVEQADGPFHKILLCPRGRTFDQQHARRLSGKDRLLFLCGRYEGFDERIRDGLRQSPGGYEEISLGNFVLAGGELAAAVMLEAAVRLIPGVLGCAQSAELESFEGDLLDYPQYTRPRKYTPPSSFTNPSSLTNRHTSSSDSQAHPEMDRQIMEVPEVLFSGDHARVARWRHEQAERLTEQKRLAEEQKLD